MKSKFTVTVDEKTLAHCLSMNVTEIRERVTAGFFPLRRGGKTYDLGACARALAAEKRQIAAGRKSAVAGDDGEALDPVEWSARLKESQALAVHLQRDVAEGRMIPRAKVERAAGGIIVNCKSRIETLPNRAPRIGLYSPSRATTDALAAAIRETLTSLAAMGRK